MSKLDRFLVSHSFMDSTPDFKVTALPRGWSNHTPLLLHYEKDDYGPVPFKFFHSWLQRDGFNDCSVNTYFECSEVRSRINAIDEKIDFGSHIRNVYVLSDYHNPTSHSFMDSTLDFKVTALPRGWINAIDEKIDFGIASEEAKHDRLNLIKECDDIQKLEEMDTAQKARIKWDIEGDENSKFFHGILKQKIHNQMVKSIMQDGIWVTNPQHVKMAFHNFYNDKFEASDSLVNLSTVIPHDCGSQKAPSPDGFSFMFLKTYWDLLKDDVVEAVRHTFDSFIIPKGANSSFITLIPKFVSEIKVDLAMEMVMSKSVPRVLVTCRSRMGLIKIIRDLIMGTQREQLFRNTCFGDETENVPLYYHMFDNFQIQFGREEFCLVTRLKFGVEYWDDYNDEDEPITFRRRVFPSSLDGKHITGKNVEDLIKGKSFFKLDDNDAVSLCCIGILQLVLLGVDDRRAVPNWILRRYPRVVAWSSNKKFYRHMLRDFLHGRIPAERLISDEIEAGSGWWVSNRAYFDGRVSEAERPPRHLNRQNHYEVPSEFYRDFQEQRSGLDQTMKQGQNIFEKMNKFMEDMSIGMGANKEPIIVDQHYGISDLSEFQSIQTPTNHSFFNMGTPINWKTPRPSQPDSSGQSQMPTYTPTPNWQPPIPSHPGDAGLCDPREHRPSIYMQSPYTPLPPTTELPKKRVGKTKKKCQNDNLSPLNLGNAFAYDNAGEDDVVITGVHDTAWTPVINGILQMRGYFYGSERQPHNFILSYNQGWGFSVPQQSNFQNYGVITCWLIAKLCAGHVPIVPREGERCMVFCLWQKFDASPLEPINKKSVGISVPNYTFQPDSPKMIFGFGIRPVTLEPTLLKITYPLYIDGPCFDFEDCRIIFAWELEVEGGFVSSCSLLFTIPHPADMIMKKFNLEANYSLNLLAKLPSFDDNFDITNDNEIRTFMHCLRPLLIIDAAHLKGQYKGTNMVVVGMDGKNQIVPIAFGICKGETCPCRSWWMSILKECIGDSLVLLFISDRHATIALAVHNEFLLAFHVVCCHHLMMNLSLKSKKTKGLFWKICKAYTPEEFSIEMSNLQAIQPDAYHKLIQVGPQRWSRAYCPLVRYNYMTSNSVKSVNACIVLYRKLPVLKLAETYRAMVQE
uniref:Transposase, MuDR, MULE transposase domain protein n=1 Tax=Tanacetum cinerariifolium TaxID=118510 RepID=A0A6L2K0V4_TANCI|nr:transposase, MuDR, MULE transposase domain protein [Tanacetum cinerariifolium]